LALEPCDQSQVALERFRLTPKRYGNSGPGS
jgi:hypothetical protein